MTKKTGRPVGKPLGSHNDTGNRNATVGFDGKKIHSKPQMPIRHQGLWCAGTRQALGDGCYQYIKIGGCP